MAYFLVRNTLINSLCVYSQKSLPTSPLLKLRGKRTSSSNSLNRSLSPRIKNQFKSKLGRKAQQSGELSVKESQQYRTSVLTLKPVWKLRNLAERTGTRMEISLMEF
jgi:hypothetical protein